MGHYFTNDLNLKSEIKEYKVNILDKTFNFKTDNGVFSKGELDFGTKVLLDEVLKLPISGDVLDLGCGYGVIGIVLAKLKNVNVDMVDINKRAVHLAKLNIKANDVSGINVYENDGLLNNSLKYDYTISNPPIRVGKIKLYELLHNALDSLKDNGKLIIVIRKEQGAKSFIKDFNALANIEILNKCKGFYVISLRKL